MSGDASVEVSVPTDLTVTSDGDSEAAYGASRRHARELQALAAERAELQRLVEKQKLELQSRDAQIAALNAKHEGALTSAVAQKDNVISSRQIQVNRLEAELLRTREELNTIRERAARELAQLTQKCAVFQQNQKRLTVRQDEIRSSLSNLQLTEEEFNRLRAASVHQLTLQQYTSLRVYELVWPLKLKVKELEAMKSSLESMLRNKTSDLDSQNEHCLRLQKDVEQLHRKSEHYSSQLMDLKDEQRSDDFKVRNFNRVKAERDHLESEKTVVSKKVHELELIVATLKKERDILEQRYNEFKVKSRKQEGDLSQYQNEFMDNKMKLDKITEELRTATKSLNLERERCEELHEKYVAARGEITSLVENNQDLQHELKLLREKYQSCSSEGVRLGAKLDQQSSKNEELKAEVERYKTRYDKEVRVVEAQFRELKEEYHHLSKVRENLLADNTKFYQDIQELETMLHKEKLQKDKETNLLNEELRKYKQTVAEYQSLEDEFAKNIRTAAALPEEQTTPANLSRILPTHALAANKSVEQCVQLTRKILILERQNTEAATTIQQLADALEQLKKKVSSYKSALGLAGQPSANLLQRIAMLDDQVSTLQSALQFNDISRSKLDEENKTLIRDITKLQHTVDRLTVQDTELNAIKQHLVNIKQSLGPYTQEYDYREGQGTSRSIYRESEPGTSQDPHRKSPAKAIIITKNIRGGHPP